MTQVNDKKVTDKKVAEKKVTEKKTDKSADKVTTNTKPKKVVLPNGVADVAAKYKSAGWTATQLSNKGIVDIFATKGGGAKQRIHFIRVFPAHSGITGASDKSDEENNTYIQNAFSNSATPVYAFVSYKDKTGALDKISLNDINLNKGIRLISGNDVI